MFALDETPTAMSPSDGGQAEGIEGAGTKVGRALAVEGDAVDTTGLGVGVTNALSDGVTDATLATAVAPADVPGVAEGLGVAGAPPMQADPIRTARAASAMARLMTSTIRPAGCRFVIGR